jgi:hypothetical protein
MFFRIVESQVFNPKVGKFPGTAPEAVRALVLLFATALPSTMFADAEASWAPAALEKFPQLEFKRDADFKAVVHEAAANRFTQSYEERPYAGFRFQAPAWIDGPVEWFTFADPLLAGEWLAFDAGARLVAKIASQPVEGVPGATRTSMADKHLNGGAIYTIVRPLADDGEPSPAGIAITVNSVRGKFAFGDLNRNFELPEILLKPGAAVAEMLRIRAEHGNEAGVAYFRGELEKRADHDWAFERLYRAAWNDAQRGTGRDDPEWGALVFDEFFMSCRQHRYYKEALSVIGNVIGNHSNTRHYGRVAELLDWWQEAQLLGGYVMDPSAYPDLGPALEFLPEVRRRDIPALAAFSRADFPGDKPRTLDPDFRYYTAQTFIHHAEQLRRAGQWREAMEWANWILELSARRHEDKEHDAGANWHHALSQLLLMTMDFGFHEQALQLAETGMTSPISGGYHGRSLLRHEAGKQSSLLDLGRSSPGIIGQLEKLIARMRANRELMVSSVQQTEVTLARAMIRHGRVADGEALLDRLVSENHRGARIARVAHWIHVGRTHGVESELITLLDQNRKAGSKLSEVNLYRMYADFLEGGNRYNEALAIRREAIRLCRGFDYFTFLPGELAKLAALLDRLDNRADAAHAAEEARKLLDQGRLPHQAAETARAILAGLSPRNDEAEDREESMPRIDLQPVRSVVIPIEGAAWLTHLILSNPSTRAETGTLSATGLPLDFSENQETQAITAGFSGGDDARSEIPLRIEAGTYRLITLRGEAGSGQQGAIEMKWSGDRDGATAISKLMIESPESGVHGSLIQAGDYRKNPYYGIPIPHTYVSLDAGDGSFHVRFKTSAAARVEVYGIDGTPLCIDAQGNGSLRDSGDELFGGSDRKGNLSMPLKDGEAAFMIVLYPHGRLPDEGLLLDVEIFDGEDWNIHAQNRLTP